MLLTRNMSQHSDLPGALSSCFEDEKSLEQIQKLNKHIGQEEDNKICNVADDEEEKIEFAPTKKKPAA